MTLIKAVSPNIKPSPRRLKGTLSIDFPGVSLVSADNVEHNLPKWMR